jgi:hypothetical protein
VSHVGVPIHPAVTKFESARRKARSGEHSVNPYPTQIVIPQVSKNVSNDPERAEPPHIIALILPPNPSLTFFQSNLFPTALIGVRPAMTRDDFIFSVRVANELPTTRPLVTLEWYDAVFPV